MRSPRASLISPAGTLSAWASCSRFGSIQGFPALPVAQHRSPDYEDLLTPLLQAHCRLRVKPAGDGVRPAAGCAHVIPAGTHLLVRPDGLLRLWRGPRVGHARPSADLLLASLARAYAGRRSASS